MFFNAGREEALAERALGRPPSKPFEGLLIAQCLLLAATGRRDPERKSTDEAPEPTG